MARTVAGLIGSSTEPLLAPPAVAALLSSVPPGFQRDLFAQFPPAGPTRRQLAFLLATQVLLE